MPYTYLILCQTELTVNTTDWDEYSLPGTSAINAIERAQTIPEILDYSYFTPISYLRPDGKIHIIKQRTTYKMEEDMSIKVYKMTYIVVPRLARIKKEKPGKPNTTSEKPE
jgi:hypothetical protein